MDQMIKPKCALVSVSDKTGVVDFCKFLQQQGVEIVSTGGTAKALEAASILYVPIEQITGNPEAFGGRMKTISFEVGSALLFRRDNFEDIAQAEMLGIKPIDLVVCNLYPFAETVRAKKTLPDLIENIDIGGPTMVRAAAKNYQFVACVTSPDDYAGLEDEMRSAGGISLDTREQLSLKAFTQIASYDLSIAIELSYQFGSGLRYGENPHQRATLLRVDNIEGGTGIAGAKFIQGKELSYNNMLDADQAYKCMSELSVAANGEAVCVIVKHGTPCGVAQHASMMRALELAWNSDSVSAFGGILCFNQEVSHEVANWLAARFIEVVIAPKFSDSARDAFRTKKNVRVLEVKLKMKNAEEWTARSISGGLLCQDEDLGTSPEWKEVTKSTLPQALEPVARFGLIVTKYLKSNCIGIFGLKDGGLTVLASGVGQPNRLDCIRLLIQPRLKAAGLSAQGAVLISDAFFPFRDSIEAANEIGVRHVLQPGGSIKDPEVIAACDEFGISMTLTGQRHFRH